MLLSLVAAWLPLGSSAELVAVVVREPGVDGPDAPAIIAALKERHPGIPVIAFPREAGERYAGFHHASGADCVAIDDSVAPEWAAEHVQVSGCVQGNLKSSHLVSGGKELIRQTRRIVAAFGNGPFIFNLGHGITPDADPANVQLMIDAVRGR